MNSPYEVFKKAFKQKAKSRSLFCSYQPIRKPKCEGRSPLAIAIAAVFEFQCFSLHAGYFILRTRRVKRCVSSNELVISERNKPCGSFSAQLYGDPTALELHSSLNEAVKEYTCICGRKSKWRGQYETE